MKHFLGIALALPLAAQVAQYDLKPAPGSRLAFEVFKTGLMSGKKHVLVFERYAGSLAYHAAAPESSQLELNIESAGIVVTDDWVSAKQSKDILAEAVGKDVLDAARHPRIRFVSSSITRAAAGFTVHGTLTIRGVDKPAAVSVTLKPAGADGALRFDGTAQVKLKDYGIKPPSATFGIIGTKNEMTLSFSLAATPRR